MLGVIAGIAFVLAEPAAASPRPAAACAGPAADCAELEALNARWLGSYVSRDTGVLDEILADDFLAVYAGGARRGKQETLARVRRSSQPVLSVDSEDLHIQVAGDVAIVTGRSRLSLGAAAEIVRNAYADTYVRRDGRWRAVSAHVVRLPPRD